MIVGRRGSRSRVLGSRRIVRSFSNLSMLSMEFLHHHSLLTMLLLYRFLTCQVCPLLLALTLCYCLRSIMLRCPPKALQVLLLQKLKLHLIVLSGPVSSDDSVREVDDPRTCETVDVVLLL